MLYLFTFIYFILLDYLESKVLISSLFLGKFDLPKVPLPELIYYIKIIYVI